MSESAAWSEEVSNLADPSAGAAVIEVSDEFFAPAKRMLSPGEPEFFAERFEEHGKWMDGWESRRRRDAGHDHCVIRICPGTISGVDIDTRYFIGNYPAGASLEACHEPGDPGEHSRWQEILPRVPLGPDSRHWFDIDSDHQWTHVRLHIYPDGGIARLRVMGEAVPGTSADPCWVDLAAHDNGGRAAYCNDMHFGHMDNLLAGHEPASMADGWETRRRREPGNDFVVLQLGQPGRIHRAVINTAWFRGNYPSRASLRGTLAAGTEPDPKHSKDWPVLLEPLALGPDQHHVFQRQLRDIGPVSHVRMDIFPDGGVARLRLLGLPKP